MGAITKTIATSAVVALRLPPLLLLLLLLLATSSSSSASSASAGPPPPLTEPTKYLEPMVQRHAGVLPEEVCGLLIRLGEQAGFLVEEESIDKKEQNDPDQKFIPSQTIDVYMKSLDQRTMATRIDHEDIWKALRPHLPMLRTIVKDNRDEDAFAKFHPNEPHKEPELNWVFMRKYSPSDKRNSLKPHQDTNMYTLNIELNDDYEGGGWLYVKPPNNAAAAGKEYVHADGVHHIPVEYMNYEWTNGLVRENNTEIVFPTLLTGDALLYNFTVYHAVAPIASGTRYSISFFYDFINPAGLTNSNEGSDIDEVEAHYLSEFKVQFQNAISNLPVDLILVYDAAAKREVREEIFLKMVPNEITKYLAIEGDVLVALVAGKDEVVAQIKIRNDRSSYFIEDERRLMKEEHEL